MQLVVVESPAKAKTIEGYLGRDFRVLASYGHIRDLPAKDGSVRFYLLSDDNFQSSQRTLLLAFDWKPAR